MDLKNIDTSNMLKEIESLPFQIEESLDIMNDYKFKIKNFEKINNVVIVGMGGSGIGGDIVNSIISDKTPIPFYVVRDYNLPSWVDENSLVICVSYSGNTEETISCFEEALHRKSYIVGITSGGILQEKLNRFNLDLISIPKNKPPRASIGYISILILLVLEKNNLIGNLSEKNLLETSSKLKILTNTFNKMENKNPTFFLAKQIFKTVPIIYGDFKYTSSIALRWRGQIEENSKMISFHNILPEMNHNEIVGYENNNNLFDKLSIIWLKDKNIHPRTSLRQKYSLQLLSENISNQFEVESHGESLIERIFYLIYWGDWLSFWLAICHGTDPTPVKRIEKLKKKLVR
tara:strand:+ start:50947 stop:51987 length:1041 start_codon:yes stop_codon:yes gene_type:complete